MDQLAARAQSDKLKQATEQEEVEA
jgi:hypothetical protein